MANRIIKSSRQLIAELTGIRLAAVDTSLWGIVTTLNERARVALNDALRTYPVPVRAVYNSIPYRTSNLQPVAIPEDVERIIDVVAVNALELTTRIQITNWKHKPTAYTNMLELEIPSYFITEHSSASVGNYWLTIDYETYFREFPRERALSTTFTPTMSVMTLHDSGSIPGEWPAVGFIEFITAAGAVSVPDGVKEYAHYNSINGLYGFLNVDRRGIFGSMPETWASSVWVYPVVAFTSEALPAVMLQAEANMYSYWAGHRAQYDIYTTLAQQAQLDVTEILQLVATYEKRASDKYERLNPPPAKVMMRPTRAKVSRRSDIDL